MSPPTNDDEQRATEHAGPSSGLVEDRADEGESSDATNLKHGRYNPSPDSTVRPVVRFDKPRVLEQVVNEGPIVASDCAVEESNHGEEVDEHLRLCPRPRRFFDHSLIVGLITDDHPGLGGIFLFLIVSDTE